MISPRRPSNGVWRNEAQFSVAFLQVSFLWNFPKLVVGCVFSFLLEAGGFKSSFFSNFQTKFFCSLPPFFSFSFSSKTSFVDALMPAIGSSPDVLLCCCKMLRHNFSWPSFFLKPLPRRSELDFHRNVYGKSRLKCFSVPEFLGSVDIDVDAEVLMAG